jgi:hypothetical protein
MVERARIIRHGIVSESASYEVRFADGRQSQFFHWDDSRGRRLNTKALSGKQAFARARALVLAERNGRSADLRLRAAPLAFPLGST